MPSLFACLLSFFLRTGAQQTAHDPPIGKPISGRAQQIGQAIPPVGRAGLDQRRNPFPAQAAQAGNSEHRPITPDAPRPRSVPRQDQIHVCQERRAAQKVIGVAAEQIGQLRLADPVPEHMHRHMQADAQHKDRNIPAPQGAQARLIHTQRK